jgi:hypothetical protein
VGGGVRGVWNDSIGECRFPVYGDIPIRMDIYCGYCSLLDSTSTVVVAAYWNQHLLWLVQFIGIRACVMFAAIALESELLRIVDSG